MATGRPHDPRCGPRSCRRQRWETAGAATTEHNQVCVEIGRDLHDGGAGWRSRRVIRSIPSSGRASCFVAVTYTAASLSARSSANNRAPTRRRERRHPSRRHLLRQVAWLIPSVCEVGRSGDGCCLRRIHVRRPTRRHASLRGCAHLRAASSRF